MEADNRERCAMHDNKTLPMKRRYTSSWRLLTGCFFAAAVLSLGALPRANALGQAAAASFDGVTRSVLERHDLPGSDFEMVLVEVSFPPGRAAPLHHHPVAGLVYVLEGTAESAYGEDPPRVYHAGDTLQDQAGIPHTVFRNTDPNKPLRFLIFYTARKGQPYLVTP